MKKIRLGLKSNRICLPLFTCIIRILLKKVLIHFSKHLPHRHPFANINQITIYSINHNSLLFKGKSRVLFRLEFCKLVTIYSLGFKVLFKMLEFKKSRNGSLELDAKKIHKKHVWFSSRDNNSNVENKTCPRIINNLNMNSHTKIKKKEVIKKRLVEWSLLTKFDCYSKIFNSQNLIAKIFWIVFFFIFSGLTLWLVVLNVFNFFKYEVTSKIDVITERPTLFPAITICDNDPLTTPYAQNLFQNISIENFGIDIENKTFIDAFIQSKLITELTKMNANSPGFEQNRKNWEKTFIH